MLTIDVRFTTDEAISLMRAIAAKKVREPDADKRDDLELIRLRLYDRLYHGQSEPIRIDMGCVADKRKHERQQRPIPDGQPAQDPQRGHAPRPELKSPRTEHEWRAA
jgi:hypothetical protein